MSRHRARSGRQRAGGLTAPLAFAPFRALAFGRAMIYFCNALTPIVLGFAVLDLGGSVVAVGAVIGARSIANVSCLLFGGVLADRLPRPLLLQGAGWIAAAVQVFMAVSLFGGFASIPLLVVLSVVNGIAAAVSVPTAAALTPQTVPAELLRPANALSRMGINAGMLLGASAGGAIAAAFGSGWGVAAAGVAFASYAVAFSRVRVPAAAAPASTSSASSAARTGPLAELRVGWKEFVSRPWVWIVVLQFMVVNAAIAGGVQVLGLTVATRTIGRGSWGLVLGAQTVGAFVGGLIAARWRPRRQLAVGVGLAAFEAVPLLALAHEPRLPVLLVAMFCNGVALEQFAMAWDVSLQENIPADRLARVYSYDAVGSFLAQPLGEILVGPLALAIGTADVLSGLAFLVVAASTVAVLAPSVRDVVHRPAGLPAVDPVDPVDAVAAAP